MVNVIVGGDVCPTGRNLRYFIEGNSEKIFNDLNLEFQKSDLNLVNLECPLIKEESPIRKCGSVHGVENGCINAIKNSNIHVANLANNHIMDHGVQGFENTIEVCRKNSILTVGAGRNLQEARKILVCKFSNMRIGILATAEHEFSIAKKNCHGANPLNLANVVTDIRENRGRFDYLVVLLHGGNENYPYPSPRIRQICRFLAEMGAGAVIVQHTHCPGCYEKYNGSHLIYGQGNLILDSPNRQDLFYQGFLAKFIVGDQNTANFELIPYVQSFNCLGARKMKKNEQKIFMENFSKRSMYIKEENFVETKWIEFCKSKKNEYKSRIFGHNFIIKKFIKSALFLKYFYPSESLVRLQNTISCESHREVLETIFENQML